MTRAVAGSGLAAWAEAWARGADPPPEVVLVRGAGPHGPVIENACPRALVVTWSVSSGAEAFAGRVARSARPDFVETLARRAITLSMEVFRASPPDDALDPSPGRFDALIAAARRRARVEQGTLASLAPLWLENLDANAARIAAGRSVAELTGVLRGRPVIVAGAGPSLDAVLPLLERAAGRFGIVAATSAARPLARAGLVPDALVLIEGRDCTHHFEGIAPGFLARTVLVADSTASPATLALPFGERYFFHGGPATWLEAWSGRGSLVPTGGNVGTAATVVAWLLGGSPIVLAGLDFALAGERYYADGSGSVRGEGAEQGASEVDGWAGVPVLATPELTCYREQTEEVIAAIARRDPMARFLSLGALGARVRGASLVDADRLAALAAGLPSGASRLAARPRRPRVVHDGALAGATRRKREIDARLATLLDDPLGPAQALVTLRPADALPMIAAGPAIIGAHRAGVRDPDSVRERVRRALDRYARVGDRVLAALAQEGF